MTPEFKLRLTDATLFGNESAEDETEEVFNSYAIERPELESFVSPRLPLLVARAYKGEGKSALLRLTARNAVHQPHVNVLVIQKTAASVTPDLESDDYSKWVRAWKSSILNALASHIGTTLGTAWSDDAMTLVEKAEREGDKSKGFVGSVLARLSLKLNIGGVVEIDTMQPPVDTKELTRVVAQFTTGKQQLWLLVDDVDKNFENTTRTCTRLGAYFDACRELSKSIPELRIRTTIRPNVWSILRRRWESMSHVEQYMRNLEWSEDDARTLLAQRISGYMRRNGMGEQAKASGTSEKEEHHRRIVGFAFEPQMQWGKPGNFRPPHVPLYTLSMHRPRWLMELAKAAAVAATRHGHSRITLNDINEDFGAFGRRRIEDTVAEFRSQCDEIEELLGAFKQAPEEMTTAELLTLVDNKILSHLEPHIGGIRGRPSSLQVAAFLFEIGFFFGRRDFDDGKYHHFTFADDPSLLKSRTNIDSGLRWEVHPVFRQALEMRDKEGRVLHPVQRKKSKRKK